MIKKIFRITVNGRTYEVEVEEIASSSEVSPAVSAQPQARVSTVSQPTSAPETSPPSRAVVSTPPEKKEIKEEKERVSAVGGTVVSAPMPGKILRVVVKEGDSVSRGDLLLVLEAMKMENEIFAPAGGVVKKVAVSAGDSVNTGDTLVVIG